MIYPQARSFLIEHELLRRLLRSFVLENLGKYLGSKAGRIHNANFTLQVKNFGHAIAPQESRRKKSPLKSLQR